MSQTVLRRIQHRRQALTELLRGLPEPVLQVLPVTLEEVESTLAELGTAAIIDEFVQGLDYEEECREEGYDGAAVRFEWYYDGTEPATEADGYLSGQCAKPLSYSNSDLVDVGPEFGLESDVSFGEEMELGSLDVGLVLAGQCRLDRRFEDFELDEQVGEEFRRGLPNLQYALGHLYHLELYRLLNLAYDQVGAERLRYVFVGSHERWPVLVASNAPT